MPDYFIASDLLNITKILLRKTVVFLYKDNYRDICGSDALFFILIYFSSTIVHFNMTNYINNINQLNHPSD